MSTEDRLRDAARAVAATVRDVRPLELAEDVAPSRRAPHARRPRVYFRGRNRLPWLVPLVAAAAVVAVAATLVAVRFVPHDKPAAPPGHAPVPLAASATGAIPRYYVALGRLPSGAAGVGDTRTGQWLGTIGLPRDGDRFAGVTGAADDRTFVLDVAQSPPPGTWSDFTPRTWYLLRIAPGTGHPAQLARLPIPATPDNTLVLGIALSPDGSRLAVLFQQLQPNGSAATGPLTLRIYSVATGAALRTWTGPSDRIGPGETVNNGTFDPNTTLTWIAGGRMLAYSYDAYAPPRWSGSGGLRMLDMSRPGPDLFADSTPALRTAFADCATLPLVTTDGRTAFCGTAAYPTGGFGSCSALGRGIGGKPRYLEYSTVTGKLTRVIYQYPASCTDGFANIFWASPSGDALIGYLEVDYSFPHRDRTEAGLFTGDTFRPLQLHLAAPPNGGFPNPSPYAF